ncbi:hypothetical protein BDR22DRAFT_816724 [Usnea florida]
MPSNPFPSISISLLATLLSSLAFIIGGQARLTPIFTPRLYSAQHAKTRQGLEPIFSRLGISAETMTKVTGLANLAIAAGLWGPLPEVKIGTLVCAVGYLGVGVYGRWRSGRGVGPPVAVIGLLVVAAVG